tara:strand:+ start:417 stop:1937 length:1521 start_codon:yes stop_codon:yes gene_type:complete
MSNAFDDLIAYCQSMGTVSSIQSVLSWDQETYMPSHAIEFRSQQCSWLAQKAHEYWISNQFRDLLGACIDLTSQKVLIDTLSFEQQRLVQELYKDWKKKTQLPSEFIAKYSALVSESTHIWQQAKENNHYSLFEPYLGKLIDFSRQKAQYLDPNQSAYDTLLDDFEPGMTVNKVETLFLSLKDRIRPLLKQIGDLTLHYHAIEGPFDTNKQWLYTIELLKTMGFDLTNGRQDQSSHPFTIDIHPTDVRVTTRLDEQLFFSGITSTVHEGGHGLYEQGLRNEYFGTPLAQAVSLGIHESQSRLWENHVCKSLPFWQGQLARIQSYFPNQFTDISAQDLWKQVNKVKPGFIRVEADEITYLCHIMIRFECECKLFDGSLSTKDLPDFWNDRYQTYLGIVPSSYTEGVLQDIHWSSGLFGYFPTYVMGSICAAQLFDTLKVALPNIDMFIQTGDWVPIKEWLSKHVYQKGRIYQPNDLMKMVTGHDISAQYLLDYLVLKYEALYEVTLS